MFGTKMVRVGNFDALGPIKYHRSSGPIVRRADEEPESDLNAPGTQVGIRLGQQKAEREEGMSERDLSCFAVAAGTVMVGTTSGR